MSFCTSASRASLLSFAPASAAASTDLAAAAAAAAAAVEEEEDDAAATFGFWFVFLLACCGGVCRRAGFEGETRFWFCFSCCCGWGAGESLSELSLIQCVSTCAPCASRYSQAMP
jgi:hypothetical protein